MQRLSVNGLSYIYNSKKKGDTMTYLEKWFDFNRRQKEIESLLASRASKVWPWKSFTCSTIWTWLKKNLYARLICQISFIWARALFLGWWLAWKPKIAVYLVAGVVIKIDALVLSAWQVMGKRHWPHYKRLLKKAWKLVWISWFKMILEKSCVRNHFPWHSLLQGVK